MVSPAQRLINWLAAPRKSVVWDSPLLRRAAPYLLLLWFVEMNLLYLGPWLFALDAHIYHRAAVAYLQGQDPWSAQYGGFFFAAAPPSLLPYLPFAWLSETVAVSIWMILGLVAGIYVIRRLRLPWWWIAFPPLTEAIVVGNAQPIALALLLANRAPFTALAAIFKLYALLPAVLKWRHVAVTALALAATWFLLPWASFFESLPAINQRLEEQAHGGYSAFGDPVFLTVVVVALVILRKHGWQWFAIPAVWPATQMHYSLYALPALTPVLSIGFSIPFRTLPPLTIVIYAAYVLIREYRGEILAWAQQRFRLAPYSSTTQERDG